LFGVLAETACRKQACADELFHKIVVLGNCKVSPFHLDLQQPWFNNSLI